MNAPIRRRPPTFLQALMLPSLVVALGLQLLRVLMPSLVWYLQDTMGQPPTALAGYAFGTFLLGFLAALIWRLAGPRGALWITAGGVAVLRLAEQAATRPAVDLWLSMAGSALFVLFLPIFIGTLRAQRAPLAAQRVVYGLILGLMLDSMLKGTTMTLDLSWIPGIPSLVVVALLVLGVLWLLSHEPYPDARAPSESSWPAALPLIGLGPYLLLQALIFQNQGWVAEVGRISARLGFAAVMVGGLLAVLGAIWGFTRPHTFRPGLALPAALYIGLAAYTAIQPGKTFLLTLLLSQLLMGWAWSLIVTVAMPGERRGLGRTTFSLGLGMLLFLAMAFLYYVSLQIAVPIPRTAVPPAAGTLLGLALVGASLRAVRVSRRARREMSPLIPAVVLAFVPLLIWPNLAPPPPPEPASGLPVRVMTYNIHSAFDVEGRQDPEAIAQVIEDSGAQIVALQEISRGWLIDGSTDLPTWLARRLGMQVLFKGTTGPMWGNAILSSLPVAEWDWGELPLAGTILQRGYLWARVDVGEQQPLLVIATHLHHVEAEKEVRLKQVPVLLEFWDGAPFSVLLGDLNAEPGYPEIEMIAQAGWVDSWSEAGMGEGLTWPSDAPFERIDWVWHTPDLEARDVHTIPSTASDHRPVVVTLYPAP